MSNPKGRLDKPELSGQPCRTVIWARLSKGGRGGPAENQETPAEHESGMTRDRLDHLLQHGADMGLEVEWCDLGQYRRGDYCDELARIRLNQRLTAAQATATLAHEIGHATFGDRCSAPALERRAWEYGASLTITRHEYAAAEALVGSHVGALAVELEVTPKLIEAWRRWYLRRWPVERRLAVEMAVNWEDSRSMGPD